MAAPPRAPAARHAIPEHVKVPATLTIATLVSRTIDPRSIYEARLDDDEVQARLKDREQQVGGGSAKDVPPALP